jgi:hypothetical protein
MTIELIEKGITDDPHHHTIADLKVKYGVSKYTYKDELYKELFELAKI